MFQRLFYFRFSFLIIINSRGNDKQARKKDGQTNRISKVIVYYSKKRAGKKKKDLFLLLGIRDEKM